MVQRSQKRLIMERPRRQKNRNCSCGGRGRGGAAYFKIQLQPERARTTALSGRNNRVIYLTKGQADSRRNRMLRALSDMYVNVKQHVYKQTDLCSPADYRAAPPTATCRLQYIRSEGFEK